MSIFDARAKEREQEQNRKDFDRGQKDGSQASGMQQVGHDLEKAFNPLREKQDAYDAGWDNGVKNPKK